MRLTTVFCSTLLAAISIQLFSPGIASATVYTLDPTLRGYIDQNGGSNGASPANNYLLGNCGAGDCNIGEFRIFFGYTIPVLDGNVTSASLQIDTAGTKLLRTGSLTATFTSQTSPPSFAGLGNGSPYGSFVYSTADTGVVRTIDLNAAALADIATDQGNAFTTSARVTSQTTFGPTASNQYVFGFFGEGSPITTLVITTDGDSVPEPASMALLGAGLAGLGAVRRRR